MKRLLIATDSFLPRWDGIARFMYEMIPRLSEKFEITVVAPAYPGKKPEFDNVYIVRFPIRGWKVADINPSKVKRGQLKKLVKRADVVWTQSIGPIGAFTMYYAKRYYRPLVSFVHSVEWDLFSQSLKRFKTFVRETTRKLVRFLYNKCDVIIIPFEGMTPMLEDVGVDRKKEVIHLGTDIKKFIPPESKALAKRNIGIDPNKLVIGYVGRFGREKDIDTLYEAFIRLKENYPNILLLLVGGELKKPFASMEHVKIVGAQSNVVPYYQAMDIYVLPSLTETTSLTTMEAMSCGVPVVVTSVGYIPEYVKHKENGMLFPPKNVERLILLLEMLIKDPEMRVQIGRRARATMQEHYSWDMTAKRIAEVLDRF
ncbi:TPA: glycosyltransferase family 4 protein [Candidatus Woesearchaeota archaeon]|nr:glycosyltransferase family 4 protein [Candidatus Woesearchaeota archaeon]